ncbi:MAG: hypothetical protein HOW73_20755 [Polyangiaceae bacterium]|nr:hypothetical protein [Polyangiaceae bacterium]
MRDETEPPDPALACPRCGGPPRARRAPTAKNPFLPKSKRLCCSLCGLDYEKGDKPWTPDRPAPQGGSKST